MKFYYMSVIAAYIAVEFTCWMGVQFAAASGEQRNLIRTLFANYSPEIRPRLKISSTVDVTIRMELDQIKDLDEKQELMQSIAFFEVSWFDEYLQWNPEDYNGLTDFVVKPSKIWLPDFGISNSGSSVYQLAFVDLFKAHVDNTGRVVWSFGGVFTTICDIDTTYFPFDEQTCYMVIENWSYNKDAVDLTVSDEIHLENYSEDGIWDLLETNITHKDIVRPMNPADELFPMVTVKLHIKRKPLYYLMTVLLPCLFLVAITLFVFWLPPDAGEKMSIAVTVMLAFGVLQLVIADCTPQNSDNTPILSLFVTFTMALSTVSIITTILVLRFHHRGSDHRVPRWLQFVAFRVLPCILFIRLPFKLSDHLTNENNQLENVEANRVKVTVENDITVADNIPVDQVGMQAQIQAVLDELRYLTRRLQAREREAVVESQWKTLAAVFDRLLFMGAVIALVVATLCLYL